MDQCVEYVYILSANFTQRRRSVGGRHKPFPLDDGAHPSRPSPWWTWDDHPASLSALSCFPVQLEVKRGSNDCLLFLYAARLVISDPCFSIMGCEFGLFDQLLVRLRELEQQGADPGSAHVLSHVRCLSLYMQMAPRSQISFE
ncbi:hypothetical protein KUCAC02_009823, partial [Chaenocephalus aceratus]